MLKQPVLEALDFSQPYNKDFIFLLLDLCERLQIPDAFQRLMDMATAHSISMSHRQKAAAYFLTDISMSDQYLENFDKICEELVLALEKEEDDENKVLATFTNYYLAVLSLYAYWIHPLQEKIEQSKKCILF